MATFVRPEGNLPHSLLLRAMIEGQDFPCLGAKSAVAHNALAICSAGHIESDADDPRIYAALADFLAEQTSDAAFRSFAVIFSDSAALSEERFERALWSRLQALSDLDAGSGAAYDEAVSSDPQAADFAISFGGQACYVIGMHANASRPARRFASPTLIFNPHHQFEELRESGKYQRLRERITTRDIALAGNSNPMLAEHGEASAARQYSGRQVDEKWVCPFADARP